MKHFIITIGLIILSFLSSCKDEEQPLAGSLNMMAYITVLDQEGNNLLDPATDGAYNSSEIKIFYEVNGQRREFYNANLDMPRNFRIDPPEFGSDYLMAIVLDAEKTIIKWNEEDMDVFEIEVNTTAGNGIEVSKVYHEGKLMHDLHAMQNRRAFTLIK